MTSFSPRSSSLRSNILKLVNGGPLNGKIPVKTNNHLLQIKTWSFGYSKCLVDMVLKSDKKGELTLIFSNSWFHLFYEDFPREIQG